MYLRIKRFLRSLLVEDTLKQEQEYAHLHGGYAQYATDAYQNPAEAGGTPG